MARLVAAMVSTMNKTGLIELIKVNLRYASPQQTNQFRKKGRAGQALTRSLLLQYVFSIALFMFIYGLAMVALDFSKLPGFFTYYVALFSILAFSQGITVIYNVFFESQDLQAYLPLPLRQSDIFAAKILVVALTVMPFVFPMFVVFLLTGIRSGLFLPLTIVLSIVLFIMMLAIVFGICCLIVFGLTRTTFFKAHKKIVTSGLLIISMVIAIGGIVYMNSQTTNVDTATIDRGIISILLPIYYIASRPFSGAGMLSFIGLVVVLGVALGAIKFFVLPKLYEQLTDASTAKGNSKRAYKGNQNMNQLLVSYNKQLVKEPNLIMQVASNSILMPAVFIVTFALSGMLNLSQIDYRMTGVVFVGGIALTVMMVNQTSFISNLISLDQENFNFIQSLPLSMKGYLKQKFLVGFVIQVSISGVIAVIGGIVMKLAWPFILSLLAGAILGTFLLCLRYFARDFNLLVLDWTNIDQLFSRGSGSLGLVLTMMASMLLSAIILVLYGFAAFYLPFWPVTLVMVALVSGGSYLWIKHYQKTFWMRVD